MPVLIDFDAIKRTVAMEEVLGHYGIAIQKRFAMCPFHHDKHPSMRVYDHGYYCFSCGAGGDVIGFVARLDGVGNAEAAKRVAAIGGLSLPDDNYAAREALRRRAQLKRRKEKERQRLSSVYQRLCERRQALIALIADAIPFSDAWCDAARQLPGVEGELDELFWRLD